jgi:uncharacterized protein YjgD (DUF1641 family)
VVIDTAKLKISTKTMLGAVIGFGSLMQVPVVNQFVASVTMQHPHLAAIVTSVMGIYALLHNPEVQDALGIKTTVQVTETSEKVTLAQDGSK